MNYFPLQTQQCAQYEYIQQNFTRSSSEGDLTAVHRMQQADGHVFLLSFDGHAASSRTFNTAQEPWACACSCSSERCRQWKPACGPAHTGAGGARVRPHTRGEAKACFAGRGMLPATEIAKS